MSMRYRSHKIEPVLRAAIERAAESRYRISKITGISAATLCRFVKGQRSLSLQSIEALMDFFGLDITQEKRSKRQ